jgi:hypothetical protein
MGVRLAPAVLAIVPATVASAATPGKTQHFKSFLRSDKEAPANFPANVPTGATLFVATDASEGDYFINALTSAAKAKLDAFRFEHRFLIGALLTTKTSGYSVTLKSIRLQRLSRSKRQFCVTAAVTKPEPRKPVINRLWFTMHAVSLSADPYRLDEFHWNIPRSWVLRDTRNKLLDVSRAGTNQQGKPNTTGRTKACTASRTAASENVMAGFRTLIRR